MSESPTTRVGSGRGRSHVKPVAGATRRHRRGRPTQGRGRAMIQRYSDHAANERTFLAWVRTAIAIMAFGFLVEKFDLFLAVADRSLAGHVPSQAGRFVGNVAGLLLILLGGAVMVLAAVRFRRTARAIDSPDSLTGGGTGLDLALAGLLTLLGTALFVYLSYTVAERL